MRRLSTSTRICALLLSVALIPLAGPAAAQSPDIRELLDTALEKMLEVDRDIWARHAFRRQVTRQRLDEDGDVEWRQAMLFQVTPTADGFNEEIVEIDGRQPTAREVAKHRKAGLFEKHYEQTDDIILENPFGADLPLLPLLFDQQHEYVGEDEVNGISCHRLRFSARPEDDELPIADKLKQAMEGTLCLSMDGSRLIHAQLGTVRAVAKGPVKINSMQLRFEGGRFGDAWLPMRFELRSDVKLPLGASMRKQNVYRYSDFRIPGR